MAVVIFGYPPSYRVANGEPSAFIYASEGTLIEVDPERERAWVGSIPGVESTVRWLSPWALIEDARSGRWGLRIGTDSLPVQSPARTFTLTPKRSRKIWKGRREPIPTGPRFRPPKLPRDLCSCLQCRDLILARRDREAGRPAGYSSPGRLFRAAWKRLGGLSACQGPGAAGVTHGVDCLPFDLDRPGLKTVARWERGRLLAQLLGQLRGDPIAELLMAAR